MILQKLLSNKNCKKYCLSLAAVFAIALAVVGRATFGGVVSEYNMPYSEWTTSMFFLQGGDGDGLQHCLYRALRYPPRLYFPRRRAPGLSVNGRTAVRPVFSAHQQPEGLIIVMIVMMVVMAMGVVPIVNNASR